MFGLITIAQMSSLPVYFIQDYTFILYTNFSHPRSIIQCHTFRELHPRPHLESPLRILARGSLSLRPQRISLLLPRKHVIIHATHIMLRLPHVCQPSTSRPLRPSPDDVNPRSRGAVDLVPHFCADFHELAAQLDGCVEAAAADLDEHAGEWLTRPGRYHQNISNLGTVRVVFGK